METKTDMLDLKPYWWEAAPRPEQGAVEPSLRHSDVAIVGSGITGLVAALNLARAGRSVMVFERGQIGAGASTRNAGYVGRSFKHSFADLLAQQGLDHAREVYGELRDAFNAVIDLVHAEKIDCGLAMQGRYIMAASPGQLEALKREFDLKSKHLGDKHRIIERRDQHSQIATDVYHGGILVEEMAGLHPGLYHMGLLDRASAAGVILCPHTSVLSVSSGDGKHEIVTDRGVFTARDTIVATNGYTGAAVPWLQKRVVPFDAYMIATESIPKPLIDQLLPAKRTFIDWNFNADFMRPSPDGSRILFGGNTGAIAVDLARMAEMLRRKLVRMLPQLDDVRLSHVWTGRCAGTRDLYPHMGRERGVYYALGYCFAGVPSGTYFGKQLADRILGRQGKPSVFWQRPFRSIPFHSATPWFVPLAMKWFSRNDWR